jgi:hypothetical protein
MSNSTTMYFTDPPATDSQIQLGVRVRCIFNTSPISFPRYGKTGHVHNIRDDGQFYVKWDDFTTDYQIWAMANSFSILTEGLQTNCDCWEKPVWIGDRLPSAIINNHICPTCKNERCSLSEVMCWRCGNKL